MEQGQATSRALAEPWMNMNERGGRWRNYILQAEIVRSFVIGVR
jgi:hypothetical protein